MRRPNVVIAAGMRTGSTHLTNSLARLGWKKAQLTTRVDGATPNDEPVVDPVLAGGLLPLGGLVVQMHARALGQNALLLAGQKVVVTTRHLDDALSSWLNSLDRDIAAGKGVQSSWSPIFIPPYWEELKDLEKADWAVENLLPWYTSFHESWRHWGGEVLFCDYDMYIRDQVKQLRLLLDFLGMPQPPSDVLKAASMVKDGKFNAEPRHDYLRYAHRKRIVQHCNSWRR